MRRWLWMIPFALCLAADPAQEVLEFFTDLAAALSANNASEFLGAFDSAMPGYGRLREGVTALVGSRAGNGTFLTGIESSVEVVRDEGDAQRRTAEVNWRLRIKRHADGTSSAPREQRLIFKLEKRGKQWKVVSLDQVGYFAP